ncbi:M24 family metallopeptidase [Marinicrinis sediminis]|uniref:M24 family metallopeptidase n=1 Tax=Marinicrinis sediminis TaxID=1652465 RepID=A0ABW5RCF6_9BACL
MEAARIERLRTEMKKNELSAYLISNSYNRRYISGFTGSAGWVLITLDRAILLTDFRYMTQAPQQAVHFEVVEHGAQPLDNVRQLLSEMQIKELAFEQDHVSYAQYVQVEQALEGIRLTPSDSLIEQVRLVKDSSEIKVMREAAQLADQAFTHILKHIKPGVTEKAIALELEVFMRSHGAVSSSFEIIVASGERSALPHGIASDRLLQPNEFVKLDFGAYYQGYCSDITRTVVLGKPEAKHIEIYECVKKAQQTCLDGLKPGITGAQGDALARKVIEEAGYGAYFGHGTGHGLGMEVHEAPRLSKTCETVLQPGMCVTVEPGIYLPDFGGVRIEDDVVITENGIDILTQSTKELITIDI